MTSAVSRCSRWSESSGEFRETPLGARVDAIDSWLVEDGQVVALDAHLERFIAACAALFSVPRERTSAFLRAAIRRIPDRGRWFPRVELCVLDHELEFRLWLRTAPPRSPSIRVWLHDHDDQRRYPWVKGADLDWLNEVRVQAQHRGADEAIILAQDGTLIEGTTTSLLWWRDDVLHTPDPGRLEMLPSVTRNALFQVADVSGTRVEFACARPEEITGLETWAVNALHGIRPVREWVGSAIVAGPAVRAAAWQARLEALASDQRRESGVG